VTSSAPTTSATDEWSNATTTARSSRLFRTRASSRRTTRRRSRPTNGRSSDDTLIAVGCVPGRARTGRPSGPYRRAIGRRSDLSVARSVSDEERPTALPLEIYVVTGVPGVRRYRSRGYVRHLHYASGLIARFRSRPRSNDVNGHSYAWSLRGLNLSHRRSGSESDRSETENRLRAVRDSGLHSRRSGDERRYLANGRASARAKESAGSLVSDSTHGDRCRRFPSSGFVRLGYDALRGLSRLGRLRADRRVGRSR